MFIKRQRADEALKHLQQIPAARRPLPVKLAFVHAYRLSENWDKAIALLEELNGLHPGRASIVYYLALYLIRDGQERKAREQINTVAHLHRYYPQFYKLGAQAAQHLKRQDEYHEYLADYYAAEGRIEAALRQLKLAERSATAHPSLRARIAVKRKDWEELQKEM